jgi:hypothetical protein
MDRIQELLTRLADLSDAEISELEGLILTEFDSAESEEPTTETVERMVSLADALDSVRGEVGRRNEHAEELARQASEASTRVHANRDDAPAEAEMSKKMDDEEEAPTEGELPTEGEVADEVEEIADDVVEAIDAAEPTEEEEDEEKKKFSDDSEPEAELATETEADTASEPVAETELSTEDAGETENETENELSDDSATPESDITTSDPQEVTVTASIDSGEGVVVTPPADAAPVPSLRSGVNMTITAGADIPGYGSGAELTDMDKVADAFAKRLHTLRNVQGGSGTQYTVATLAFEYPEDRKLSGDDPSNITRVNKVVSPQAITAAAGICAPLETIYDINVCGDQDRPIRDALARFNADRGGVKIYGAPTLGAGSVGIWDTSGAATKTCADAGCPSPTEIMVDAIYACLKFSNFTNRFFPEVVKANTDLAMINHARVADINLLKQISQASTLVTATDKKVGLARQVIYTLSNAAALLRRKHRLAANAPMRAILPSWVQDAVVADLALQMPGDGLENLTLSEAKVNEIFRARGVNVTWSLDSWDGSAVVDPPTGTEGFETAFSFALFPEGTFLFLDGGTLDLGIQRDGTMIAANEYATFVETFEGVAKTGCESLWITTDVCVSGAAAALVDTQCA